MKPLTWNADVLRAQHVGFQTYQDPSPISCRIIVKCRDFYEFGERLVFVFSTNSTILPLFSVRFRLKEKKSELQEVSFCLTYCSQLTDSRGM